MMYVQRTWSNVELCKHKEIANYISFEKLCLLKEFNMKILCILVYEFLINNVHS